MSTCVGLRNGVVCVCRADPLSRLEVLPDNTEVAQFVKAVRNKMVDVLMGGHLQLRDGVVWPGTDSSILFVHGYFKPLFESVLLRCVRRDKDKKRATIDDRNIITGQPGIGKSLYG